MNTAFEETLKAIKDRISSPTTGTFTIIWLIINWKIFLVLIYGKESFFARIEEIDKLSSALDCFWKPLLITLVFLLFMPFVKAVQSYWVSWIESRTEDFRLHLKAKNDLREFTHNKKIEEIKRYDMYLPAFCNDLKKKLASATESISFTLSFMKAPANITEQDITYYQDHLKELKEYNDKIALYFDNLSEMREEDYKKISQNYEILAFYAKDDLLKKYSVAKKVIGGLIILTVVITSYLFVLLDR